MRKGFYLEVNALYLNITNNKDNISVLQFVRYETMGNNEYAIFRDILDGQEYLSLSTKIAYTEKKFRTLSKLTFDEVVELFYSREFPYEYEFDKQGDKDKDNIYIDPIENFNIYSKKAREIIIAMGKEKDYYIKDE